MLTYVSAGKELGKREEEAMGEKGRGEEGRGQRGREGVERREEEKSCYIAVSPEIEAFYLPGKLL